MIRKINLFHKLISAFIAVTFLFSNYSLAGGINISKDDEYKLAARSRIQLFFSKNNVELSGPQEIALSMAIGQLQKSILREKKSNIMKEIQQLNTALTAVNIKITTSNLEINQKLKIPYVAISVNTGESSFRVYFLKPDQRQANKKLMIEEKDLRHFDCPGLEGVWFVRSEGQEAWEDTYLASEMSEDLELQKKALEGFTEQDSYETREKVLRIWALYRIPVEIVWQDFHGKREKYSGVINDPGSDESQGFVFVGDPRLAMRQLRGMIREIIIARPLNIEDALREYFSIDATTIESGSDLIQKIKLLRLFRDHRIPVEFTWADGRIIFFPHPVCRVFEGVDIPQVLPSDDLAYDISAITAIRPITDGPIPTSFTYNRSDYSLVEEQKVDPVSVYEFDDKVSTDDRLRILRNWRDNKVDIRLTIKLKDGSLKSFDQLKITAVEVDRYQYPDDGSNILVYFKSEKIPELWLRSTDIHSASIQNRERYARTSAFMVGETSSGFSKGEFVKEVKTILRSAFHTGGAVRMFSWSGNNILAERNTGSFAKDGTNEAIMEQDTFDVFIERLLAPILQKYPHLKLVFVEGVNLLNYKSLSLYQMARASTSRNQIYLPMNLLYLLHLSGHPEWVIDYIVTYESIRKENDGELLNAPVSVIRTKTLERLGAEGKAKQDAFVELLQLSASIEEISRIISENSGKDLLLHLTEEGRLQIKGTDKDALIFDLDTQKAVVEDYELRLTYWDILKAHLSGRKDSLTEVITKGLELPQIRELLIQTLLRRKLIAQDSALSEQNLERLAGIAGKLETKKKITVSSKLLLDNVVKAGDNKFEYNQNATGIKYILEKIQSGFDLEIINESGITESELQGLIFAVFDIAKDKINVIAQGDAEKIDYKDGIVLLHENSNDRLKAFQSAGTKVLIGEIGISFNVLLTVGIHKLLGIGEEEMRSLLVSLGYSEDEARDIISRGLLILPPIRAFAPILNDIALFKRTIDISA